MTKPPTNLDELRHTQLAALSVQTAADLDALPDNALVVDVGGRAWKRWKHQWFSTGPWALPRYATELVEHSPLQVVWTPDGQTIVNNDAPESDTEHPDPLDADRNPDGLDLSWITAQPLPEVRSDGDMWSVTYPDKSVYVADDPDRLRDKVRRNVAVLQAIQARDTEKKGAAVEARARALYEAVHPTMKWEHLADYVRESWLNLASDPDALHRIADMDGGE